MIGIWLDLAMKTGLYTIEKVDLLWEMRILHDFTKQKCDVILHFIDKKDRENTWFWHIFTITWFFVTKNPWGFHPENAGKFTSRITSGIPGTSRTPGFAILVWLPSAIRASFPEDVEQLRGECGRRAGAGGSRCLVRWWIIKHGGQKQQMDRNDGKRSPGSAIFGWFNPAFCLQPWNHMICWYSTMKPYDLTSKDCHLTMANWDSNHFFGLTRFLWEYQGALDNFGRTEPCDVAGKMGLGLDYVSQNDRTFEVGEQS